MSSYRMRYRKSNKFELYRFFDSDWAGSVDDMKSTSGYCFSLGSACFSWCSKKQEIVAQSTAEVEFVAATSAMNQAIWLRKLLNDMDYIMEKETKVSVDNQAAVAISKNLVFHDMPFCHDVSRRRRPVVSEETLLPPELPPAAAGADDVVLRGDVDSSDSDRHVHSRRGFGRMAKVSSGSIRIPSVIATSK
ncbi:hypothetical protein ZIOFF_023397 [Zingiber officinale]|uniref:Uncharacterized protein n=1 Tax=Zingiber officinale TaxID=94328 RepID=A0A8J5L5J2_ZINOF|nr:hypothetical protein ZIOFF_023397 [Zingiber officinale]